MESGGVAITQVNPRLIGTMTGAGYGWDNTQIDREIRKYTDPPQPEAGRPEEAVRPYIEALAHGGVTEDEAYMLINAHGHLENCISCHLVDVEDLPEDRADRDSWEWDTVTARITVT